MNDDDKQPSQLFVKYKDASTTPNTLDAGGTAEEEDYSEMIIGLTLSAPIQS